VLILSRATGRSVRAADGRVVGKLRDLTARIGVEHPMVYRLVIGSRRGPTYLVPWAAVTAFEPPEIQLCDVGPLDRFLISRGEIPLERDELLLVRDVLDTQIVDVVGHRLSRVSDVVITRAADGRLEVVAVDVGGAAVCRRLGLRRLGERLGRRAVDWSDLHLTSARGHDVHLATTTAALHQLDAQGLAELLTRLDLTSATEIVKTVGPVRAAGAVARAHPTVGRRIILSLEPQEAAKVIDELPAGAGEHYRRVVSSRTPLTGRRFRRSRGWRLRRPPATTTTRADVPGRKDGRGFDH
jgi:sporulation protein YlmC with PRC-barrel domain